MRKKKDVLEEQGEQKENKESFFQRCKTDKKYKAKVELIGYGGLLLFLIIYANIIGMNSSGIPKNIISNNSSEEESNASSVLEKGELIDQIDDNYEYDIQVSYRYLEEGEEQLKNIRYYGKRYGQEVVISKEIEEEKNTYYRIGSLYYAFLGEKYQVVKEEEVYDFIENTYIELDEVKEYLEIASLDHVTDYSSGKKEFVYHLKVRDVVMTYLGEEEIEFSFVEDSDVLSMKVDYSDFLSVLQEEVLECSVEYTYRNINKVEEFHVMDEENTEGEVSSDMES